MKYFQSFSKSAETLKWGPIPGRYFYISEFEDAVFKDYSNFYSGPRWPDTLMLFKDKKIVWINDSEELRGAGKEVFKRYMLKPVTKNKLRKQWNKTVKNLSIFEGKIEDLYLEKLTDKELHDLWQEFYRLIIEFWLPTIPAELGNYGSGKLLEEKLKGFIKEQELVSVAEILTAPEKPSFHQEEEIALSKEKDLDKHARKYFWLMNSYIGTEKLTVDFFAKRKKELLANIKKLIEERIKGVKDKKRKINKKYKLSQEVKDIAKGLREGIEWQDERKKHVLIYLHYKDLFLKEVARRFNYNIDALKNCSTRENMQILEKRGTHTLIENRGSVFGFYMNPVKKDLIGEEAIFCWDEYLKNT